MMSMKAKQLAYHYFFFFTNSTRKFLCRDMLVINPRVNCHVGVLWVVRLLGINKPRSETVNLRLWSRLFYRVKSVYFVHEIIFNERSNSGDETGGVFVHRLVCVVDECGCCPSQDGEKHSRKV